MFWCCCGGTADVRIDPFRMSRPGFSGRPFHVTTGASHPTDQQWSHVLRQNDFPSPFDPLFAFLEYSTGLRLGQTNTPHPNYQNHWMSWSVIVTRVMANAGQTIQSALLVMQDTNFGDANGPVNYGTQPAVEVNVWVSRRQFTGPVNAVQFSDLSPAPFVPDFLGVVRGPWGSNTYGTVPNQWNAMNGPWITTPAVFTTAQPPFTVDITSQVQEYLNAATSNNGYMMFIIAAKHPSQPWFDSTYPSQQNTSVSFGGFYGRRHWFAPESVITSVAYNHLQITV